MLITHSGETNRVSAHGNTEHSPSDEEKRLAALREKRRHIWEILVTSVIFGLTMNVLSDLLLSLPEILSGHLFLWNVSIGGFMLVATLGLLFGLMVMHAGELRAIESRFTIALVWDTKTRSIAHRETGYWPQRYLQTIVKDRREKKEWLFEVSEEEIDPEYVRQSSVPLMAVEAVLFDMLAKYHRVSGFERNMSLEDIIGDKNVFITDATKAFVSFPYRWRIKYDRSPRSGISLKVEWRFAPLRMISVSIVPKRTDWFDNADDKSLALFDTFYKSDFQRVMSEAWNAMKEFLPTQTSDFPEITLADGRSQFIRTDFEVYVRATFSTVRLFLGIRDELVDWATKFVGYFQLLSWSAYQQLVAGTQVRQLWL